mmetsp:Transcript_3582/g.7908  ORF Transcript_3582/g.7908 Transcript_3582/m.7908 type:complete len:112 (+) Transcript_3582:407-742(+)
MLSACLIPWDIFEQEEGEVNEEMGEFTEFAAYFANDPLKTICYLMIGSMMSLVLSVLTFVLVNRTSPVAASLLGNARSIATVAISSVISGNASSSGAGMAGLFSSTALGYT